MAKGMFDAICGECGSRLRWRYGATTAICGKCGPVPVRRIKLAPGELTKAFGKKD